MSFSIPSDIPEDRDHEIEGAGDVALTRPREVQEDKDILAPPIAGTNLVTERVCSTEQRLTLQRCAMFTTSAGELQNQNLRSWRCRKKCWWGINV